MFEEDKWAQNSDQVDIKEIKFEIVNEFDNSKSLKNDQELIPLPEQIPKIVIEIFEIVWVRRRSQYQKLTDDFKLLFNGNHPNKERIIKEKIYDYEWLFDLKFIRAVNTK